MQHPLHSWLAGFILFATAPLAAAQTTLTVSPDVAAPGTGVTASVAGPPGAFFAIIGSVVDSGMSYGGIALAVGPDVAILAQGVLDGTGQATVTIVPLNPAVAAIKATPSGRLYSMGFRRSR